MDYEYDLDFINEVLFGEESENYETICGEVVCWFGGKSVEIRMKQGDVSGLFRVGYGTISVSIGDVSVCIR